MSITQISPVILTLDDAATATAAGVRKAAELGVQYTFSVLDGGGNTVLVTRMDGAALASIDTSGAKARTAVYFGAATADLAPAVQSGAPLSSIQTATTLPLAFVAGGVPITDACGIVVGALGAGGGSPAQDHEVAAFAVQALRRP